MFDIEQHEEEEIISHFQIPVKPQVLIELQQEQAKAQPDLSAFAEVIAKDVALSAYILRTINAPVFGLNRTITDIRQGVTMLSMDHISSIISFFQLKNISTSSDTAISHERYWDAAMDTANMMGILIEQLGLQDSCSVDDAYAFGLFRDCGIPLMAMKYPDYKQVLIKANTHPELEFTQIEDERYETSHDRVGFFLASSWNLPKDLCELILRHHELDYLDQKDINLHQKYLYAVAKIASNALSQYKLMIDDTEWYLAKESVLGFLGLSEPDYQDIEDDSKETYRIEFT